jgi:ElaB/YqjD/DUF883 family membrane-anchored ribosome-binding protein
VTTDTTRRTTTTSRSSTSWVWIAVAAIVGLLLLAWLFGWLGTERVATVPAADEVVIEENTNEVIEDTEEGLATTGTAIEGAAEDAGEAAGGAVDSAGEAIEGAAEETGQALDGAAEDAGDTVDITPEAEAPEAGDGVETQTVPIQPAD